MAQNKNKKNKKKSITSPGICGGFWNENQKDDDKRLAH